MNTQPREQLTELATLGHEMVQLMRKDRQRISELELSIRLAINRLRHDRVNAAELILRDALK